MKRSHKLCILLIFSLFTGFFQPIFSEDTTPLPYEKSEFPQFLKDLRRFEIISLGAMPFVTLDTTLAFSGYKYVQSGYDPAYSPNPFAASSFNTDEQKTIILTSLAISIGIGLTDYIIQLIKRSKAKRIEKLMTNDDIYIYPLDLHPEDRYTSPDKITADTSEITSEIQEVEE